MRLLDYIAFALCAIQTAQANTLPLPARQTNAPTGSEIAAAIRDLEPRQREERIFDEVAAGNIPDFLRTPKSVSLTNEINGVRHVLTFGVTPDYLAVGSDTNFLRIPLTPMTAQRIANLRDCSLPTPRLVDEIWAAAELKLTPEPMPPGPAMIGVPAFEQHQTLVEKQFGSHPHTLLVAGHKKDIVLAAVLATKSNSVAIYGWHKPDGKPIQPVYAGHASTWADYSHGIRLIANTALLDGKPVRLPALLTNAELAALVSAEGPLRVTRYSTNWPHAELIRGGGRNSLSQRERAGVRESATNSQDGLNLTNPPNITNSPPSPLIPLPLGEGNRTPRTDLSAHESGIPISPIFKPGENLKLDFKPTGKFSEAQAEFRFDPEVRVVVNKLETSKATNTLLVIYTLPNGNTIEQTAGHRAQTNEDWHFNIQHIAAQTRFVRERLPEQNIVVAYVEAGGLTWPSWRKRHGDDAIPAMVRSLQSLCADAPCQTVLSGHSGGGSFIFGYLNAVTNIPTNVERVAFLDSNYGYTAAHKEKLLRWLRSSETHRLLVFAYNDAAGLLNGKSFVSAEGGTWGRSALMLDQLGTELQFSATTNGNLHTQVAANGRVEFLLRENPERKIWHTVQVERNGFIHALLTGTPLVGKDYEYLGERAYERFISDW